MIYFSVKNLSVLTKFCRFFIEIEIVHFFTLCLVFCHSLIDYWLINLNVCFLFSPYLYIVEYYLMVHIHVVFNIVFNYPLITLYLDLNRDKSRSWHFISCNWIPFKLRIYQESFSVYIVFFFFAIEWSKFNTTDEIFSYLL